MCMTYHAARMAGTSPDLPRAHAHPCCLLACSRRARTKAQAPKAAKAMEADFIDMQAIIKGHSQPWVLL